MPDTAQIEPEWASSYTLDRRIAEWKRDTPIERQAELRREWERDEAEAEARWQALQSKVRAQAGDRKRNGGVA